MVVAINASFIEWEATGLGYFIHQITEQLSRQQADNTFVIICNKPVSANVQFKKNVQVVIVKQGSENLLSTKWWYNVKLPLALKLYKADVLVTHTQCCRNTPVPQVLIVDKSIKRFSNTSFKKAKIIATVSNTLKDQLVQHNNIPEAKIINVESAANTSYKPLDWQQKELVKDKYTEGCEYFIFNDVGDKGKSFIRLLKAFSSFKKWQKTNMKLVILHPFKLKEIDEKIKSYKYRNEIIFINNSTETELAEVIKGGYCLIITGAAQPMVTPVLEAMQSEVAVIATNQNYIKELALDAALYTNADEPDAIAEQMKKIFKDEALRNNLIAKGSVRAAQFTWQKTADLIWQSIEKAVSG